MSTPSHHSEIAVIGGGVIGLICAWRLAQRGHSVTLFERGEPGQEASRAALGVLNPSTTGQTPFPYIHLSRASLALFPALVDELKDEVGMEVGLRDEGVLLVALDDDEAAALEEEMSHHRAAGIPVEYVSAATLRQMEPMVSPQARGAMHFTSAMRVDNIRLCHALALAAQKVGVNIVTGALVNGINVADGRVNGVQVGGRVHGAEKVIVAAGSWSSTIAGIDAPVRPIKGQGLLLKPNFAVAHVLESFAGYVTPGRDGHLLIGATVEDIGYDQRVTAAAMQKLLTDAIRLVPALENAALVRTWAGLRPCSADTLPVLGPVQGKEGLYMATAHFRNGILLAPITAQLIGDWVEGKAPQLDVAPFAADRFV
ncbi:MAG: glycine oxidase ThiO [Caldilineaceae bacterium]